MSTPSMASSKELANMLSGAGPGPRNCFCGLYLHTCLQPTSFYPWFPVYSLMSKRVKTMRVESGLCIKSRLSNPNGQPLTTENPGLWAPLPPPTHYILPSCSSASHYPALCPSSASDISSAKNLPSNPKLPFFYTESLFKFTEIMGLEPLSS